MASSNAVKAFATERLEEELTAQPITKESSRPNKMLLLPIFNTKNTLNTAAIAVSIIMLLFEKRLYPLTCQPRQKNAAGPNSVISERLLINLPIVLEPGYEL
jgi:hypothetical protein